MHALSAPLLEFVRFGVIAGGEGGVEVVEGVDQQAQAEQGRRPVRQRQGVELRRVRKRRRRRRKLCMIKLAKLVETDRNPNLRYLPKPNILHLQNAEYSAETEYSAEYLIFCKLQNIRLNYQIFCNSIAVTQIK